MVGKRFGRVQRAVNAALVGLTVTVVMAGCTEGSKSTSASSTPQSPRPEATDAAPSKSNPDGSLTKILWHGCDVGLLTKAPDNPGDSLDCGELKVPVDYSAPKGKTMSIAMARHRATSKDRIGSLLINPGGPGGGGREFLLSLVVDAPKAFGSVIDRFDIIGFDPRGVGGSGQVVCVSDRVLDEIYTIDITPETPEERAASDALDDKFDAGCLSKYGRAGLLALSTENTARDMDTIRQSVGDRGLSFFGVSYGTYLGATYASLFPNNVRALVLDGAYDPAGQDLATQSEISLSGREDSFRNWAKWCETSPLCAFGEGGRVDARWLALRATLDKTPAKGKNGREANQGVFMAATGISLYSRDFGWIALGSALKAAEAGDGELTLQLADSAYGRNPNGTFDGRIQAGGIISCSSGISPPPAADPGDALRRIRAAGPHFAIDVDENDLTDNGCGRLPEGPKAKGFSYTGSAPILVIGGTNDPATPFVWATKMAGELGANARLLTYDGEGHGAVLDSTCAARHAASLLVDLKPVQAGQTCSAPSRDRAPIPAWFSSLPPVPEGRADLDLTELAPLIGFDLSAQIVSVTLSAANPSKGARLVSAFKKAGWSAKDGETMQKKIDGTTRRVTFGEIDLQRIRVKEPMLGPMATRLLKLGKSIVYVAEAPNPAT